MHQPVDVAAALGADRGEFDAEAVAPLDLLGAHDAPVDVVGAVVDDRQLEVQLDLLEKPHLVLDLDQYAVIADVQDDSLGARL